MANKHNLKVDQTVWFRPPAYRWGDINEPVEGKITAIGKKYFYVYSTHREMKFDIETLKAVTSMGFGGRCYLSLKELQDEKTRQDLNEKIRKFFSGYGDCKLSIDQMQRIVNIIEDKNEASE